MTDHGLDSGRPRPRIAADGKGIALEGHTPGKDGRIYIRG
jgi:hypothetical protein